MNIEELRTNYIMQRYIIEQNFPLNELVPEYNGLTQNTANVYCVFHPNYSSPSAKLYWDDEKDILVLHCFSEHKTFTAYDYVNQVLCYQKGLYKDPTDYIIRNIPEEELHLQILPYVLQEGSFSLSEHSPHLYLRQSEPGSATHRNTRSVLSPQWKSRPTG